MIFLALFGGSCQAAAKVLWFTKPQSPSYIRVLGGVRCSCRAEGCVVLSHKNICQCNLCRYSRLQVCPGGVTRSVGSLQLLGSAALCCTSRLECNNALSRSKPQDGCQALCALVKLDVTVMAAPAVQQICAYRTQVSAYMLRLVPRAPTGACWWSHACVSLAAYRTDSIQALLRQVIHGSSHYSTLSQHYWLLNAHDPPRRVQ